MFQASSSTRSLKASQDSSRLMKCSGPTLRLSRRRLDGSRLGRWSCRLDRAPQGRSSQFHRPLPAGPLPVCRSRSLRRDCAIYVTDDRSGCHSGAHARRRECRAADAAADAAREVGLGPAGPRRTTTAIWRRAASGPPDGSGAELATRGLQPDLVAVLDRGPRPADLGARRPTGSAEPRRPCRFLRSLYLGEPRRKCWQLVGRSPPRSGAAAGDRRTIPGCMRWPTGWPGGPGRRAGALREKFPTGAVAVLALAAAGWAEVDGAGAAGSSPSSGRAISTDHAQCRGGCLSMAARSTVFTRHLLAAAVAQQAPAAG